MALNVYSSNIRYFKAKQLHALDVTRMGTWLARKAGEPMPGEPFAPSWLLLNFEFARTTRGGYSAL